jgi:malic enzyme
LSTHRGTAEALAQQVTEENFEKGLIYPPFSNIRKISAHIAANVAAKAYELGQFPTCLFFTNMNAFFVSRAGLSETHLTCRSGD